MIESDINDIINELDYYNRQSRTLCSRKEIKSLREFVDESLLNRNNILENHLFIEFRLRTSFSINENYGNYNGQVELVKFIAKKISESNKTKFVISSKELDSTFENVFFKEIKLYKSNHTSYSPDDSEYLDDEQLFDKIVISYEHTDYNELLPDIMHELTHAWDNYNSYLKGSFSDLGSIATEDRFIAIDRIRKFIKDNKSISDEIRRLVTNCSHLVYSLSKTEQNAFVSEIRGELLKHEGELLTFKQAVEIFQSSRSFKDFSYLSKYIDELKENGTDITKEAFRRFYNQINKNNWTFDKIYKKLRYQLDNYFQKISKLTAKIYFDWCEQQKKLSESKSTKLLNK